MIGQKERYVNKIIAEQGLFVSADSIKQYGLNSYDINVLLAAGRLERIKRGLYTWKHSGREYNELAEVAGIVPDGVLCLFSALGFHELTTYIPKEHTVAILRTMRKPVLPPYPPIKIR